MPGDDALDHYELGPGVHVFVPPAPRRYGDTNLGLVVDPDGLTIVDTLASPRRAHRAKHAITELTAELELPIKRVVVSSSRVPFSGGSWAFWQSAFLGSEATSDQLDEPANLEALRRLLPELADDYHEEFETRPITHTVSEAVQLTDAIVGVPLPGESPTNLVTVIPGADVVFAGALASFGVTPLAFDGDPAAWADSLETLLELGTTIVPGHGQPGGAADVADLVGYLRACVEVDGDAGALPTGPWDAWSDRRFDEVNVERAARLARGDGSTPEAMFRLLGFA
ncbi:MAG: hypothetical protein ACRBI6_09875 [Acidimicrobiales bacterium]